jgi:Ca-activated chloride channel family protein
LTATDDSLRTDGEGMLPQFANPNFFWLLLLLPPLVWWWLRRRRIALRHPAAGQRLVQPGGRARYALPIGAALRGLGLLLLIVALTGARWPDQRTRVETEGIAVVLLVDVSDSMGTEDFYWDGQRITRLDAVKRSFRLFVEGGKVGEGGDAVVLEGRPGDLVAIVPFDTRPDAGSPLTLSHSTVLRMLDAEKPRNKENGYDLKDSQTNISDAVVVGLEILRNAPSRRKVLVLLTDGEHNVQPVSDWKPRQTAQVAGSLDVPIYALDAGGDVFVRLDGNTLVVKGRDDQERSCELAENVKINRNGSPCPLTDLQPGMRISSVSIKDGKATLIEANTILQEMARISSGRYFDVRDTSSLLAACRELDRLERTPVQSYQYRRYYQGYPWFGLAALLCWTMALALDRTIWRRFP